MTFSKIIADIKVHESCYVDSREHIDYWKPQWVVYSDLIGFAADCMRSQDVAINKIVRFHRIISDAKKDTIAKGALYQFTDSAYFVTGSLTGALEFGIKVLNRCLAHSHILISDRPSTSFSHLIVPRVTAAFGSTIDFSKLEESIKNNKAEVFNGIDVDSFLAGSGIVRAYQLEGSLYANEFAIAMQAEIPDLTNLKIRGAASPIKDATKRWATEELNGGDKERLLSIPWTFIGDVKNGEIWVESKDDAKKKIKTLIHALHKMQGDFHTYNLDMSIGKHIAGLQRGIFNIICLINRQKKFNKNQYIDLEVFLNSV